MWLGFQIGAGFALFGVLLAAVAWVLGLLVDLVDAWSSRLTPQEARRRAQLASIGQWPPPPLRPWSTAREWIWLTAGLLLILVTAALARHWSQSP